jgi:hypothetical protein
LLYVVALYLAVLQNFAIGGTYKSMRILVEGSSTGLESTIEKGSEVGVHMEIRFGNFVETTFVRNGFLAG